MPKNSRRYTASTAAAFEVFKFDDGLWYDGRTDRLLDEQFNGMGLR